MAIQNAMLAGGSALSLLAGALAGHYALLPAHGGSHAEDLTPLRVSLSASRAEPRWRDAPYASPTAVPASAIETASLTQDDGVPHDPSVLDPAAAGLATPSAPDMVVAAPPTVVDHPDGETTSPPDTEAQPRVSPSDAPAPSGASLS